MAGLDAMKTKVWAGGMIHLRFSAFIFPDKKRQTSKGTVVKNVFGAGRAKRKLMNSFFNKIFCFS
jgi:hypothetical protein